MTVETPVKGCELDRLSELVSIGAGHAASAFAMLTGRTIWMGVPKVLERTDPGSLEAAEGWMTGVFFEFEGCLDAVVGILFEGTASEAVVRRVVGMEEGTLSPHMVESALMEVGNILASHVASAIADTLRERLLPSIPTLAMTDAGAEFERFIALREGPYPIRIESSLIDESAGLGGLLVMVPRSGDSD
jgi:chemotaxis protein CheC